MMQYATRAETFRRLYSNFTGDLPLWNEITAASGKLYDWPESTYIAEPPFLENLLLTIDPAKQPDAIRERERLPSSVIQLLPTISVQLARSRRIPQRDTICWNMA